MTTTSRPTSIRLDAQTEHALDAQAAASRASRSEIMARAIREWLRQQDPN